MPKLDGPRLAPASGKVSRIVLLLHGYGSNGADLISLAPHWRGALPDTLFVAPNAPERCPGAPGGYQWWPLTAFTRPALAAGVKQAAPVINAYIDDLLAEHDVAADRLAIVGFSQGTMMALHVGPLRPERIAGVLGYSGMLADPAGLGAAALTFPPILLVHGDADPVVPIAGFHEARHALERLGFDVTEHVSHGLEHSVDMAGLQAGQRFIRRVLG